MDIDFPNKIIFSDEAHFHLDGFVNKQRSCDLTPLDYFLWGYLKSLVYAKKPTTIEALKAEIVRINEIQPEVLKFVIENFVKRVRACNASRGRHLPDILFHT